MATIVEGINKLITAAGGTPTGNGGTIDDKLDQLKDVSGGGGGAEVLVCECNPETWALDKTVAEIKAAFRAHKLVMIHIQYDQTPPQQATEHHDCYAYATYFEVIRDNPLYDYYHVNCTTDGAEWEFMTQDPNGYPVADF